MDATSLIGREAREHFLEITQSLLVVLDHRGRIAMLNPRARALFGFAEGEELGVPWMERCVPPAVRAQIGRIFSDVLQGEAEVYATVQSPVLLPDGSQRLIAWTNSTLRDEAGQPIGTLSSGIDITEAFSTGEALASSQRQLEEMKWALDQAAIVAITDVKGRITYCNDKFSEISGYEKEELIGQDHRILNSGLHSKEFIRDLWVTIANGRVWRGEIRNRRKDGEYYWVDTTIVPFVDESGRPYQYLAIRTDITDRKHAEQRLTERTALARLGEMASVVAHEVKNPLAGIGGALQVIVRRLPEQTQERAVIHDILKRIELLNDTMEDLLDYARPSTLRVAPTPLRELLEGVCAQLSEDPRFAGVTLAVEVCPDGLQAPIDTRHVSAALLNLAINAAQAMPKGGHVLLRAVQQGELCTLTVADDGPGIPAELRDRIFEPFFTTRHQGTGLGLAIVRQTAERHGGRASLRCPERGGTEVSIALPM